MPATLNNTGVLFNDSTQQNTSYLGVRGQVFTANGTFTIPSGITAVKVTVVGGGGGGGLFGCVGRTGGGGATGIKFLSGLTPGATLSVTVGAGGASPASGNGGTGGTSSVASGTQTITTISASGGNGATSAAPESAGGSTINGADLAVIGGFGSTAGAGARAGESLFSNGQSTIYISTDRKYGGGGIYAVAGGVGVVIFEW